MRKLVLFLAIALFGGYAGSRIEADSIQKTCEDDDSVTLINGTPYLCLSQRHLDLMRAQASQRRQGA
ncbi:hypothetical protein WK62_05260 [Burkholderia ubonensis]|uniref:hypothetical protein n=1 Tax=Burkholderia ubonensis TaxID=101571 RepID=UPI0007558233|nr:hypothetical protein [Burkholderia ubonensis]KVU10673.1 hypothetical protein WK62_05260 [Burkholderia ubonensis]